MIKWFLGTIQSLFRFRLGCNEIATVETKTVVCAIDRPVRIYLGTAEIDGRMQPVFLDESEVSTHLLCMGRTGRGKSVFALLLIRAFLFASRGFALVDPKGSLFRDVLADIAKYVRDTACKAILNRVLVIELTLDSVPLLNAMHFEGDKRLSPEHQFRARVAAAAKDADVLVEIIHRHMGEGEEGFPRVKRILRDLFVAIANVGLEFSEVLVLLDPFHKRHDDVWEVCKASGCLPPEVQADLHMINSLKRDSDKLTQIEGPLNRLRSLLSPLLRACFADRLSAIDFNRAFRDRLIILVNAEESRYVSRSQALTIGGIVIHRLIEAAGNEEPREQATRQPYPIFVDEAAELFSNDLDGTLRTGRSKGAPVFLFGQNLRAFLYRDVDYTQTVINEPGVAVLFQLKAVSEMLLNLLLHGGLLDTTRATREVDRPDGYDLIALPSFSSGTSRQASASIGGSRGWSDQVTDTFGTTDGIEVGVVDCQSHGSAVEDSRQDTRSSGGERTVGRSQSRTQQSSCERSQSLARSTQETLTIGHEQTDSETVGRSESQQYGTTNSDTILSLDNSSTTSVSRRGAEGTSLEHSVSNNTSRQLSEATQGTSSTTFQDTRQSTRGTSVSEAQSHSNGRTRTTGVARRIGESSESGTNTSHSRSTSHSNSSGRSRRSSVDRSYQQRRSETLSRIRQQAVTHGGSVSRNFTLGASISCSESHGISVATVARHRTEIEVLPQLETPIDVQTHELLSELSMLRVAQCFFRNDAKGYTVKLNVAEVKPAFDSVDEYYDAIDELKAELRAMHAYLVEPDLSDEAEAKRVRKFVEQISAASEPNPQEDEYVAPVDELATTTGDEELDEDDEVFN